MSDPVGGFLIPVEIMTELRRYYRVSEHKARGNRYRRRALGLKLHSRTFRRARARMR